MKTHAIPLFLALSLATGHVLAHGEAPQAVHGGLVQEAQEMWLELVVKGTEVTVYVLDEARKPVPASQIVGTATVLVGGKSYKVDLSPTGANSVQGTLPVAATSQIVATVSLKIGGKAATARFTNKA
ncbi:hypothetical protein [Methylorubrum extorquens]|jgi:hypothetical protein|uniref:Adenylosuccinate synthase n=5 Tax=Methylorubrum extorquens TaxID=408 RepID=C5B3M8_METEA|nr:hypothetical protein [Methylorubrum extorquens]ACK81945.1 conserved hypothetical protein [Methylorubrum extorquens CM4]ACS43060.1 conserved hypothetical protein [Methylorubrum extorquens AM1]EHP92709.1 hypothetical protein MetexDRAFT_2398 [Methylorubrum extorquens DSM 13060]MCP1545905.1 hypothetical protein [Methylorubrum extorquens]MCP1591856.1 hypothetical protein [Methylorubrum extorquens]